MGRGLSDLWSKGQLNGDAWKKAGIGLVDTLAGGKGTFEMVRDVGGCFNRDGIASCTGNFAKNLWTAGKQGIASMAQRSAECKARTGSSLQCAGEGLLSAGKWAGNGLWNAGKSVGTQIWNANKAVYGGMYNCARNPRDCAKNVGSGLKNVATGLIVNPAKALAQAHSDCKAANGGHLGCYGSMAKSAAAGTWNAAKSTAGALANWVKPPESVRNAAASAWYSARTGVSNVASRASTAVSNTYNKATSAVSRGVNTARQYASSAASTAKSYASAGYNSAKAAASSTWNKVKSF